MTNDPLRLNIISSIVCAALSLTCLLAPDLFWNPNNGLSPYTFVNGGALGSDSNGHFDSVIRCGLRATGAAVLGSMLFHFFLSSYCDQGSLLRYKIVLFMLQNATIFETLLLGGSSSLDKKVILSFLCYNTLVTIGLWQVYRTTFPRHPQLNQSWALSALVRFWFSLPFALVAAFAPQEICAQGRIPFYRFVKTPKDILMCNDAQLFVLRMVGATLLAQLYEVWETRNNPSAASYMMGALFWTAVILDGALDVSGQSSRTAFGWALGIHYLYVTFLAYELDFERAEVTRKPDLIKTELTTDDSDEPVPDLAPIGGLRSESIEKKMA